MKTRTVVRIGGFSYRVTDVGIDAHGRPVVLLVRLFDASEWYAYRLSRFARVKRIPDRVNAHLDPRTDNVAHGAALY